MSLLGADRAEGATLLCSWVELREGGGRRQVPVGQQEEAFLPITNSASISLSVIWGLEQRMSEVEATSGISMPNLYPTEKIQLWRPREGMELA